jgi:hypothetical protein
MQFAYAASGRGRPRRLYPLNPASFEQQAIALRGGRRGRPRSLHPILCE